MTMERRKGAGILLLHQHVLSCRIGPMKWHQCWQQPLKAQNGFSWRMQPFKIGSLPWKEIWKPREVFLLFIY